MKTTKVLVAAALALSAVLAQAASVTTTTSVTLVSDQKGGFSAGISKSHTIAGDFVDVFNLTGLDDLLLVDGLLQTAGRDAMDISFSSIALNGLQFSLIQMASGAYVAYREIGALGQASIDGPLVLTVTGHAGGPGIAEGSAITASYSGTVNAINDVPEPASLALVATALAAAGFVGRRRNAKQSA